MNDPQNAFTGSQKFSEPVYLVIGHLRKPHGIAGEIAMQVLTDFPERLKKGKKVFLGDTHIPIRITNIRWKQDLILLSLEGYTSREKVAELTNLDVYVTSRGLPSLPEGQYYHHELIGLNVFQDDKMLGIISEILITGANDVYIVKKLDGSEILLPAIESVIKQIDLVAKTMQVFIPNGLLDN